MAILHVAGLGQPVLRSSSQTVPKSQIDTPEFQQFLDDLIESMRFHDGVGLAAPQVFRSQRVFAVEVAPGMDEDGVGIQACVLINPELSFPGQDLEEGWEGCLSLKDLRGMVPRHTSLTLKALDRRGQPVELQLSGFPARVVQHEADHLDGIVFLDRMPDLSTLVFEKELQHLSEPPEDA